MILNTRPADQQNGLTDRFETGVVACPVLEMLTLPWVSEDIENFDALITTSQSAFRATESIIQDKNIPVYAVGRATAEAALKAGFSSVQYAQGTAESLLHMIDCTSFEAGAYLSARQVSTDLALARPNRITRKVVYEMRPADTLPRDAVTVITSGEPFVVPFYSPRSLEAFERLVCDRKLEPHLFQATAVLIHSRLSSTMTLNWHKVCIADRPANDSLVTAIQMTA